MEKLKVAIKYCGGCNPRFDRRALITKLCEEFEQLEPVSASTPDPWLVIVVNGCSSACAGHEDLNGKIGKVIIGASDDYSDLREIVARNI